MKARPRRHVELQVRMVHAMQSPKGWDGMEKYVLQVDGEIERHHGQRNAEPCREIEHIEQPPPSRLGNQSEPDGGYREYEANQDGIDDDDADVAGPACSASELLISARRQDLPGRHDREDAGKRGQPDQ